jgi:hypothetical protein
MLHRRSGGEVRSCTPDSRIRGARESALNHQQGPAILLDAPQPGRKNSPKKRQTRSTLPAYNGCGSQRRAEPVMGPRRNHIPYSRHDCEERIPIDAPPPHAFWLTVLPRFHRLSLWNHTRLLQSEGTTRLLVAAGSAKLLQLTIAYFNATKGFRKVSIERAVFAGR